MDKKQEIISSLFLSVFIALFGSFSLYNPFTETIYFLSIFSLCYLLSEGLSGFMIILFNWILKLNVCVWPLGTLFSFMIITGYLYKHLY